MNKDIYQLKVVFTDAGNKVEGMPYRVIQFHKDTNLQQLAMHILKSFSFKMNEPFGFYNDLQNWPKSEYKFELFEEDPKKNTLKNTYIDEIFDIQKDYLLVYDYLEEYRFLIFLEKQVPERNVTYPDILESRGETTSQNESVFNMEEEDDEPKYGVKKKSGGFKDEFDEYEEDEVEKLTGREGGEEDEEDEMFDDEAEGEDEFGFDELGSGGYDDDYK